MMVNTSLKKVVDDKNHILEEVFDDVEDIFKTVTFWWPLGDHLVTAIWLLVDHS